MFLTKYFVIFAPSAVKKISLYSISLITCIYFLSAGNISLFSKFKKNYVTEFIDIDEDAAGKEDKTESPDSKEDNCGKEDFLNQPGLLLSVKFISNCNLAFFEKYFLLPKPSLEINSPPPQA